jgi:hypothetical protein
MLTKFWEGLGGKFAEQFVTRVLTPAFMFWAGGVAAWVWGNLGDDIRAKGWKAALEPHARTLQGLPGVLQGALLVAALLGLVGSAVIAERVTLPLLRLLEGYWPGPLGRSLRRHSFDKRKQRRDRAGSLAAKRDASGLTPQEDAELVRLEEQLNRTPATLAVTMPTRLGNLLRATEARPRIRYGLETGVC